MSRRLWTLVSSSHAAATEIEDILADPDLHREAKALAPALAARASAAGPASVKFALAPLVLVYGISEATKSPAFWQAYEVLSALPVEALEAGIKDYIAAADSEFFPKPGPLKALCEKHAAPIRQAAYRVSRAAALPAPITRKPTEAEREAVHKMAQEVAARLKSATPEAWPKRQVQPVTTGKPDPGGLTPEMRAWLEKQRPEGAA